MRALVPEASAPGFLLRAGDLPFPEVDTNEGEPVLRFQRFDIEVVEPAHFFAD